MTVRFVLPDGGTVEYAYGHIRAPAAGEAIVADGSDPDFPPGIYKVRHVTNHVGLRGPSLTVCDLSWVYALPDTALPGKSENGERS